MKTEVILANFLDSCGRLTAFPARRKMKLYALIFLASRFDAGRVYTEDEVNEILDAATVFHDPATLRRELVGNRFLARTRDCSAYRPVTPAPTVAELGLTEE